jgi:hypothetical protein
MKWIIITIAAAGIIGLGFISKRKSIARAKEIKSTLVMGSYSPVAVLELFTSEGCSSCPSADRLLPQLVGLDSNIIPLSFHVDYWNRLGWTDPFSNSEYSERQRSYARQLNLESVYTPQLIVNGEYELVGSNRGKAEASIKKALADNAAVQLTIENVKKSNDKLSFIVRSEGDFKKTNLLAALVQKQATMNVKAGENSGAKLSHTNVVRVLSIQTTADKNEFKMELPENLTNDNWQLVVYTQQKNDLKITGAVLCNPKTRLY